MRGSRFTPARWRALKWFYEAELDPMVLLGRSPTRRMCTEMLQEGQLEWSTMGLRTMPRLQLTEKGRKAHLSKYLHLNDRRCLTTLEERISQRNKSLVRPAGVGPGSALRGMSARLPR